jgi:hypothetical protein
MDRLYQGKRTAIPAELVEPLLMVPITAPYPPFVGIDWGRDGSMTCVVEILDGKIEACTHVTKSWRR